MNIVYIHQYFMTDRGKSGTRSYGVAKHMASAGHKVHMICGIHEVSEFKPMPWYKLFERHEIDGIDVIVCNVLYSSNFKSVRRMWSFLWFAFLATMATLRVRKPDLVFATSTPLTAGIPGYIGAKLKRVPFVFEVRDLWPESFIRSGWATGNEPYIKIMSWLEKLLYKHAVKILLVSKGFEERLIERGYPEAKLHTILLGASGSLFCDITPNNDFLEEYNLNGKKIAIFTGAHGRANGLDYVLDCARYSLDRDDIAYVLIGSGSHKAILKERAKEEGLKNVVFADPVPQKQLPRILAVCHIGLMILADLGEPRPVTPNKIFDYMFAGIPSLVNFKGPTTDMVLADSSGFFVDPQHPEDMAEKVKMLADDPQLREKTGQRGRKAAWEKYDRKIIADQLLKTFEEARALYPKTKT